MRAWRDARTTLLVVKGMRSNRADVEWLVVVSVVALIGCSVVPTSAMRTTALPGERGPGEVYVWVTDDSLLPPDTEIIDGPCGAVTVVPAQALAQLPPGVGVDTVYEVDDSGEVQGTWRLPVYWLVAGLEGSTLLVWPDGRATDLLLAITDSGVVTTRPPGTAFSDPQLRACPVTSALPESAYLRCWSLVDRSTRRVRVLAYEGPCT